jgi:8-oxo-dGTP pyrophosphatase MutT (NUDIX family)
MSSEFPYSAAEFRRRALDQVGAPIEHAVLDHGDHFLNVDLVRAIDTPKLRDAAVLVPVVDDGPDAAVIFTKRTEKLRKHSGQVAFPGGSVDAEDGSPERAAIREAEEEIGLDPSFVEPVARMPQYLAATGFRITPVLAVVRPGFKFTLNQHEVDDVFEVPLSFLMQPENHRRDSGMLGGAVRHFYRIPYGERMIWGVTAGIVRTIYERLYA